MTMKHVQHLKFLMKHVQHLKFPMKHVQHDIETCATSQIPNKTCATSQWNMCNILGQALILILSCPNSKMLQHGCFVSSFLNISGTALNPKWFQLKKWWIPKLNNSSRSTTFILVISSSDKLVITLFTNVTHLS
jgi:hypothetical protein